MSLNKVPNRKLNDMKIVSERRSTSWAFSRKRIITLGYIFYITFLLLSRFPNVAENVLESRLQDTIEYHLTFSEDGWSEHYYIERYNDSRDAKINLKYTYSTNTIEVDCYNVKNLKIDCRSMFEEKSEEVFGFSAKDNSNYYKLYFIEKDHLNVNVDCDREIITLNFIDMPIPYEVWVNDEQWLENTNYFFEQDYGMVLTNVLEGHSNVDIYFNSRDKKAPVAQIKTERDTYFMNENIYFIGEGSYDPDGQKIEYFWDFGDGNFVTLQKNSGHKYESEGIFGVILTVRDEDQLISHAYKNITILNGSIPAFRGVIPDQIYREDSEPWELNLTEYRPGGEYADREFRWYVTGEDRNLYSLSGENSTNGILIFSPNPNAFGDDRIRVWVWDNNQEISIYQDIWVKLTPVNDAPIIIDAPDLVVKYDTPYTFDYSEYILDVDSSKDNLTISTSDENHASVKGLEVTYSYSREFIGRDDIFVVLEVADEYNSSKYLIQITVIDGSVPVLKRQLPDVEIYEGETRYNVFNLNNHFSDPGSKNDYRILENEKVTLLIHDNLSVTLKAPHDWSGMETINIRLTSNSGVFVEDHFTVTVLPRNDAPEIKSIPEIVLRYEQDYVLSLRPYIYDEDDPIEKLIITTSDPANITVGGKANYILKINYPRQDKMPYEKFVKLFVSDGKDKTTGEFKIIVSTNYPPEQIKPIQDITFYEDSSIENAFNIFDHFIDQDGDSLKYNLSTTNIIYSLKPNGEVDLSAPKDWFGQEVIFVTVRDNADIPAFCQTEFFVTVVPRNDAPEFDEIPAIVINVSETARIDLRPYIHDVDNEPYELELFLQEPDIDSEVYGFDLIIYGNESFSGRLDLEVTDGQDSAKQIVLVSVIDNKSDSSGILKLLWFFAAIIVIIILISSIFSYRRYFGNYKIIETFLIYENGCLINHNKFDKTARNIEEVDLVGSMFTAVQDFIEDSFSTSDSSERAWSLKKMEFGNNNILIERGKYTYLAVVFSGRSGTKLIHRIKTLVSDIEKRHENILKDWDGDLQNFSELKIELE